MTHPDLPAEHELYALSEWFAALQRADWFSLVPPEEWHALSALLSLPHRDGMSLFSAGQLAYVLGTGEDEAVRRLGALARIEWQGRPLAAVQSDAYGQVAGASLAPLGLFSDAAPIGDQTFSDNQYLPTGQQGRVTTTPQQVGLAAELERAGLYADQVDRLLAEFPEERIRRHLAWLPARKARVTATLPDGSATRADLNASGQPVEAADENGILTRWE